MRFLFQLIFLFGNWNLFRTQISLTVLYRMRFLCELIFNLKTSISFYSTIVNSSLEDWMLLELILIREPEVLSAGILLIL